MLKTIEPWCAAPWSGYAHKRSFIGRNWIPVACCCVFFKPFESPTPVNPPKKKLFKSYLYAHSRSMHYYAFIRFSFRLFGRLCAHCHRRPSYVAFFPVCVCFFKHFYLLGLPSFEGSCANAARVGEKDLLLFDYQPNLYAPAAMHKQTSMKIAFNCLCVCNVYAWSKKCRCAVSFLFVSLADVC